MNNLNQILDSLQQGSLSLVNNNTRQYINNKVIELLNKHILNQEDLNDVNIILHISNILYNNTSRDFLILEDGVYDLLLEKYKKYNHNYQVGAEPIVFREDNTNIPTTSLFNPLVKIDTEKIDSFLYKEELLKEQRLIKSDLIQNPFVHIPENMVRKTLSTTHKYPKLVGTLEKVKFVLNTQAEEKGVINDSNVAILERDFFGKHIQQGILDPNRDFYVVLELKYDGTSVEAEVSNKVITARQRGDANENLASDITSILKGYRFKRANEIPENNVFGMKFEAIMTYPNLHRYNQLRGKEYKNCRSAIVSLVNSLDGYLYRDLVTLVPLATSLEVDRLTEIEFMNKYYCNGEYLRYTVIHGNYIEVLFQIKKFVEEAEYLRSTMPFMYDGVVVSYIEPDLIDVLGRENSINKYSIAVKFNPLKKSTIFRGYTYTVGQNGVVTPMIHFDPMEFFGTIHTKSTGHSLDRFLKLGLREGDIIDGEYVGDVMSYITKPDNDHNNNNPNPIISFITTCPFCGNKLKVSDSGKSMIDDNIECSERNKRRIASLLQKLNLKDFAEETLSKIAIFRLKDLLNVKASEIFFIGEGNAEKFVSRMTELKTNAIYDYKIVGSLGFTDVAVEKWKLILNVYSLLDILNTPVEQLRTNLNCIKGVGPITINTICDELEYFKEDLITITQMSNIIISKGIPMNKAIRFSGVRDSELVILLNSKGYDANDNAGVTKSTSILLIPNHGYTSTKTTKAGPNTLIITIQEFKDDMEKYLGYI